MLRPVDQSSLGVATAQTPLPRPGCTPACSTTSAPPSARASWPPAPSCTSTTGRAVRRVPVGDPRGAAGARLHGPASRPGAGSASDPAGRGVERLRPAGDPLAAGLRRPDGAAPLAHRAADRGRAPGRLAGGRAGATTRRASWSGSAAQDLGGREGRRRGALPQAGHRVPRAVLAASGNEMFAQAAGTRRRGAHRPAPLPPDAALPRRARPCSCTPTWPRRSSGGDGERAREAMVRIMEQAFDEMKSMWEQTGEPGR